MDASQSLLSTAHGSSQGPSAWRCLPVSGTEGCGGSGGMKWSKANMLVLLQQHLEMNATILTSPQAPGDAQMGLGEKRGEKAGVRS